MVFGEGKRKRRNKRIRQYRNTAEGNVTPPRLPLIYLCSIETGVSPCYPPKVSQANRPTPIYKTNQFALWRATKPGARRVIIKTLRTGISRASGREARFEKVFALSYTENASSRTATADRTTTFQLTTCGTERDGVGQPRQWTLLIYREFEKGEGRERSVKTYHKGRSLFFSRGVYTRWPPRTIRKKRKEHEPAIYSIGLAHWILKSQIELTQTSEGDATLLSEAATFAIAPVAFFSSPLSEVNSSNGKFAAVGNLHSWCRPPRLAGARANYASVWSAGVCQFCSFLRPTTIPPRVFFKKVAPVN